MRTTTTTTTNNKQKATPWEEHSWTAWHVYVT